MIFDLEEKPGTRFDMEDGSWVELRMMTSEDWVKIKKKTVSLKPFAHQEIGPDGKSTKWIVLNQEIVDEDEQAKMINDLSIVGWGGQQDGNKKDIPCNKEMKTRLMRSKDSRFRDFVNEKMDILTKLEAKQQEESVKNSSKPQSGQ